MEIHKLAQKILEGDRRSLAKGITLVSSALYSDQEKASKLLSLIEGTNKKALRVGITGIPGVGKSSFIESLGCYILSKESNINIAILAIDPSSPKSGGSILGDKIRMNHLSSHPRAYIRPIPNSCELGGLFHQTHEVIHLMESASFDFVFVETVGVGQADDHIANYVDVLINLQMPSTGDDIQGIKRGAIELCDIIIVNKNDSHLKDHAKLTAEYFKDTCKLKSSFASVDKQIFLTSAKEKKGFNIVWEYIYKNFYKALLGDESFIYKKRQNQLKFLLEKKIEYSLKKIVSENPQVLSFIKEQESMLLQKKTNLRSSIDSVLNQILKKDIL